MKLRAPTAASARWTGERAPLSSSPMKDSIYFIFCKSRDLFWGRVVKRQTLWAAIIFGLPTSPPLALPSIGSPKASVSTSDTPLATLCLHCILMQLMVVILTWRLRCLPKSTQVGSWDSRSCASIFLGHSAFQKDSPPQAQKDS